MGVYLLIRARSAVFILWSNSNIYVGIRYGCDVVVSIARAFKRYPQGILEDTLLCILGHSDQRLPSAIASGTFGATHDRLSVRQTSLRASHRYLRLESV